MNNKYRIYSDYLKEEYGQKVYKLPINIPTSCPNRDGTKGINGCIFCGGDGAGNELLSAEIPVKEQLRRNRELIEKKYKAHKFIAYFQSFSNTYLDFEDFKRFMREAAEVEDIVELSISTRPDCILREHLEYLDELSKETGVKITIELGLQTANNRTLKILNRGHEVKDFLEASKLIKEYGFNICAHIITDLPWDSLKDVKYTANILNQADIDFLKIHSLYVEKGTVLEKMYKQGFELLSSEDFIDRTITLLELIDSDIVIERLVGRVPEADSVIANWHQSWWKIKDQLDQEMIDRNTYQGKLYKNIK